MTLEADSEDLTLPEQEFTYVAGSQDRPWSHFTGRWKAMRPHLERMLGACGGERPLRIVDVGSCTGYFSLQAAYRYAEADVVGIEGSVGIGNGTTGTAGSARQILTTGAVQTHLRWIQRMQLSNCFVAPEVWDYKRICELCSQGRPIGDVMFLLSVVHHIDICSTQQYTDAGMSRLDGFIDMMGRLLLLSPRHFVELPNKPWLAAVYDAHSTQRAILEAAALASGREWSFKGPIYSAEWFGNRELWVMEVKTPMPPLDLQSSPFLLLYRGEEQELAETPADPLNDFGSLDAFGAPGPAAGGPLGLGAAGAAGAAAAAKRPTVATAHDEMTGAGALLDSAINAAGDPAAEGSAFGLPLPAAMGGDIAILGDLAACKALGGTLVDPGLMCLAGIPCPTVDPQVAEAVATAPVELLVAHLTLREAIAEADDLLLDLRNSGVINDPSRQAPARPRQPQPPRQHPRAPAPPQGHQPSYGATGGVYRASGLAMHGQGAPHMQGGLVGHPQRYDAVGMQPHQRAAQLARGAMQGHGMGMGVPGARQAFPHPIV